MSLEELSGKVAIVTGAAQGMGNAIAQALAEVGAHVVLADINGDKALAAAQRINAVSLQVDVTDEDAVQRMVDDTVERWGTVHVLVNNAGILRPTRISAITKAEWDQVLDVNLNGTFLCTKAVLELMKAQRYGRIVNMSSSAGRSVSTLGGAHYTAAKAGVLGLTRAVAKEVAPFGITVNAVCPGLINTDMVRAEITPERIQAYENTFPIPRLGTPQEVAALVLFLVTNADYITGAAIDINGGDLMM